MKPAFFTMDAESYFDTVCIKEAGIPYNRNFSCAEEIGTFASLAEEFGGKVTFFVSADFLSDAVPYLKKAIADGHFVSLHCNEHISPLKMTVDVFEKSITSGKNRVAEKLTLPRGYRAPCFGLDNMRFDAVRNVGFLYDASGQEKSTENLDLSGFTKVNDCVYRDGGFYEVKCCIGKVLGIKIPISGGAYARIIPWFIYKSALKNYLKHADAFSFYVHPFELHAGHLPMPKQPHLRMYLCRGRKNYIKRIRKIAQLLKTEGFSIIPIEDFLQGG